VAGTSQPASSLNLPLKSYYSCTMNTTLSFWLLQQEASALAMKYSCDKQQWYLNSFLLGVKLLVRRMHEKRYLLKVLICIFQVTGKG
jgi:hypothetical protein